MRDFDVDATRPGRYLTDGARLFRIVAPPVQPPHGGLLAVEDCHSLDVVLVGADQLRRLRRVARAPRPHERASVTSRSPGADPHR